MAITGTISLLIIIANFLVSYRGFKSSEFFSRYSFEVEKVLLYKQYDRIVTSGFLHVSWTHLIFNMISLFLFTSSGPLGPLQFLLVYFGSLICGNLFALLVHRKNSDYSSVGASGAVCGVIFAGIAIIPDYSIRFFFIPIGIPGWIYGLAFALYSIYGIRSRKENVGHEAHLGGALAGMILAIITEPSALLYNTFPILIIFIPCLTFIFIIVKSPSLLFVDNLFFKQHARNYTLEDRYNAKKIDTQKRVDQILEKIHKRGINSLTQKEKDILDEYSKTVR